MAIRTVLPWSYSSYAAYQTCPRQFYEVKIAKSVKEETSDAIIWGNDVHKALEDRAKDPTKPLPDNMARFQPIADRIINAPGDTYAELKLACDINLQAVDFFDDEAWCRGVGDLIKVNGTKALNADWKTGKVKPNSLQLDLMSVLTFAAFPEVEIVTTAFIWFQRPDKPTSNRYHYSDIPRIMDQFSEGVADMQWSEENGVWPEKESGLCRGWCPVQQCKFWKPKYRK